MNTKLISAAIGVAVLASSLVPVGLGVASTNKIAAAGCTNYSNNFSTAASVNDFENLGPQLPVWSSGRFRVISKTGSGNFSYFATKTSYLGDLSIKSYVASLPAPTTSGATYAAQFGFTDASYRSELNIEFMRVYGGASKLVFRTLVNATPPAQKQEVTIPASSSVYLRIDRKSNVLNAYYSFDGVNYTLIGASDISAIATTPLYAGMGSFIEYPYLTPALPAGTAVNADFDDLVITCGTPVTPPTPPVTPVANTAPIYRFLNKRKTSHFYTMDKAERDNLIANNSANWKYEGVAFNASTGPATGFAPVYRFYSSSFNSHFYTMDAGEKNNLIATNKNWSYQGVAYYAKSAAGSGFAPVYRFYGAGYKSHFWTKDVNEKNAIVAGNPNWKYEGVGYYAK